MIGIGSASSDGGLSGIQYAEARARLVQHTIEPLFSAFEDELNHWLAPEFGDVWVTYDHDILRDLVENDTETSTRVRAEFDAGLRTWEESRRAIKLSPLPEPTDSLLKVMGRDLIPAAVAVIDPSTILDQPPATDNEPMNQEAPSKPESEGEVEEDEEEEGETYRVQDVLSHPKLYEFYPDLANKEVRIINEPDKPMSFGAYNFDSQTIDLNVGSMPFIDQDPVSVISGLLHESQHYAQQVENFLRGTSKSKFLKRYTNKTWDQASKVDKEKATRDYLKSYGEAESRNVQLRFEDPFYAKTSGSVDKTKGKVFPTTMGQDKDTMAAFNRPLGPTEFINNEGGALDARLDYVSPFPSTVEDMQ